MRLVKFLSLALISFNINAQSLPARGGCPSGSVRQGDYCMQTTTRQMIVKDGVCPMGFTGSGAYCLSNGLYVAYPKAGVCTGRSQSSGKYCIMKIEERQEK